MDNGYYIDSDKTQTIGGTEYRRFNWKTNWSASKISNYDLDGNIPADTIANYKPTENSLKIYNYYEGEIYYQDGNRKKVYKGNIVKYSRDNEDFTRPIISGDGRDTINNSSYINTIGAKIRNFEDSTGVKSYLIGYASGLTTNINYIGNKIGTAESNRYVYNSTSFNLDEIFKNIATDIMADFWIAAGPQIK